MLTEEQIKNLKPGDNLALSYPLHFREYDSENDELLAENNGEYIYFHAADIELPWEHGTEVPTPKHDPTRLFKKGDKVRVVEWNGRNYSGVENGKCGTVIRNEAWMTIAVNFSGDRDWEIEPCYLELVTPVEEMEPYEVTESSDYYGVDKDDLEVEAAIFWKKAHPNAKAAAEAECKRLNDEWKQSHQN